jgi:hypothetical protein
MPTTAILSRCDTLAKTQANKLKAMLITHINEGFVLTATVKNDVIGIPVESEQDHTSSEGGVGVVYTQKFTGGKATSRDVYELVNKDRPYICRTYPTPSGDGGQKQALDCFYIDNPLGGLLVGLMKNNKKNTRDVMKWANNAHGTNDREQWEPWERALTNEFLDQRKRFKYVISARTNIAGHMYPDGSLSEMITETCHTLLPGKLKT